MQRTKSKILSILLSLVMLLSLLPTTALAATYYHRVKVNDILLENGHYLASNSSTSAETGANTEPTTYVAWYKDGVLTLNGYEGKGIETQGVAAGELTVKLIGTNSINNGSLVSDNGGNIIVTSDSSGTLSITNKISDSDNAAIGIEAGYGNYETGNVTITGSADVKIEVTHNGASGYEDAYGIFAKENITISENASVDITCATPNNTYSNIYCNGLRADKNVTINTDGTIKINVIAAGDDGTQSYGIYPMGNATLTKVGEMEVQWKKHKTNTSYPGGAIFGSASFSDTDHAINEDTTNCYASYRFGTPRTVMVENGTLTGPGVPNASGSGMFLENDTVNITPYERKGKSGETIPFKGWTSSDVTLTSPTTASNSFTVPGKDVTVTAKHSPFVGAPTFTPTGSTGTDGTLTFKTVVKADETYEGFRLVKEGNENNESSYISIRSDTTSTSSPYEYSYGTNRVSGGNQVDEGNYYVVAYLNNDYYLSEKFTVDYTAAPTGNYPDSVRVYNANKGIIGLGDKQYLATNDATSASTGYNGTQSYVAHYDKSSGTLYLKGYQGVGAEGGIVAVGDLNIKVEGDSSFTTSRISTENLMGIQASGKLDISGPGKLTVTANGNGDVYGIYANEGVTISAPLDVQVGKVDSSKNGPVYGIYTRSGAISLSGADKTITATGGTSSAYGVYNAASTSTITDNGNIDISGKLTVNLNSGSSNVGIYTGSSGTITLDGATVIIPKNFDPGIYNNNGNVIIKNNSNVTLASDVSNSWGVYAKYGGDLIIENSTVKVSADSLAACLERGNVSIKDSTVELTSKYNHYEVIRTGNSSAANTIDLSGNGSVTLTASGNQTGSMIGGTVSITTPGTKCVKGTYYGSYQNYDGEYDGSSKTVLQFVHETTTPAANISLDKTGTVDFGSKEAGYTAAPAAQTVTITNSGTAATGELTIALDGANKTDFTLSKDKISDIAASNTDTFTVQPKTGLLAGIYNATVKVSGTGVTEQSFDVKFIVTAPLTAIAVPTANSVTYDGTEKIGVSAGTGYTLGDTYKATDVGTTNYAATATLETGYKWNDGSTDVKTINWNIGKRTPTVADFTFAPPTDLTYDGNNKTASVTLNSPLTKSGTITPTYMKGGSVVTETKAVGTYTVKIDVAGGDNFNAGSNLNDPTWTFSITPAEWGTPTETLTPVNPTTAGGSDGQITGTTSTMQYKKSTDSSWKDCTGNVTGLTAGTYYVRYKADGNHTASDTNYKTVTLTDPGATLYGVTVTDGTAAPTGNQAAGTEVTITANTKTGFNFKEWTGLADGVYKPGFTKTSNPATFTMPASAVNVTATYDPAALTGTASITGTLKFNEELTASLTGTNNTGTLTYKWYRGSDEIIGATGSTYTLRAEDINKTITVKITSSVQTGEITSAATATVEKADSPAAPAAFTLTFALNSDGATYTATIPAITGGEYSFDGTTYSSANTKADCTPNTSYTGYARIAATTTHKASTATSSMQTSPKLTVATPTFTPNGASGFTGTQSVTISCTTAGAKIYYTTDGTTPTTASTLYTTALSLTSTTTVKAIAVNTGMNDSAIATATFTKYSGGGGGGGGSYTPSYTVSVDKTENGTITVSPKSASKGDTVTITVKPDKGYELDTLKVLDKNGDKVKLTEKNGKYSFKMPSGKVEVKATFIKEAEISPFDDVSTNAYYYEAVKWAQEKGITGGIGNKLFGPNQPCTRAQIVTFLWRAAGSPAPKNMSSFADVPADAFYAKAVAWAVENGITGGTGDGKFSPDATCTRAQSVTFLYRAAGSPKVSGSAEFGDVATNAYYADAVAWAAKNGITGGIGGGLFGSGNDCTRAQIVTFLYRSVK